MSTQYTEYPAILVNRKFSWAGVFSGTFLFLAIEATFGVLGADIFGSTTNANSTGTTSSIGIAAGIWMVVLSIIALYFAGRLASSYSAAASRNSGMYAGLVTFGLSVFTAYLVAALAFAGTAVVHAGSLAGSGFSIIDSVLASGYWLFAALILGMIAAGFGGIHGSMTSGLHKIERTTTTTDTTKRVA